MTRVLHWWWVVWHVLTHESPRGHMCRAMPRADMTRRIPKSFDSLTLSIPFDDRQTDPTFIEEVMDEVWDMVKRVRVKSGPRQQTYSLSWPTKGQAVEIIVRRV